MMPNREIMEHEVAEVYRKASDTDRAIISHALGGSFPDAKNFLEALMGGLNGL